MLKVKLPAHRAGLSGNENMIIGSAFLPAPAYRQEGGASSRLAREAIFLGHGEMDTSNHSTGAGHTARISLKSVCGQSIV